MYFFEKFVRIKIEDHKIPVLMSRLLPKLDEVNASYPCKCNLSCETFMYFIEVPHNCALFQKIRQNQN